MDLSAGFTSQLIGKSFLAQPISSTSCEPEGFREAIEAWGIVDASGCIEVRVIGSPLNPL